MDGEKYAVDLVIDSVILTVFGNKQITKEERQTVITAMFDHIIDLIKPEVKDYFIEEYDRIMKELIGVNHTINITKDIMEQLKADREND